MRFQAHRPYGPKLNGITNVKIRGINQVPSSTSGGWVNMWGSSYDWPGWLKKGIDRIVVLGANTIKVTGLSAAVISGGTFDATSLARVRNYLDYTASVGLYVYWQVNAKTALGTTAANISAAVETARFLKDYPHVIALDLWNEPNAEGANTQGNIATHLAACVPQIKAIAPHLPLTVSVAQDAPAWASNAWTIAIAPYVDFYDVHVYETGTSGPVPTSAQVTAWRQSSLYKPFLYGEVGTPGNAYVDWPFGDTQRTTFYNRMATRVQDVDCYGAVAFCLTDYDGGQFGFGDETMTFARSSITGPFATWRGVR